MRKTYILTITYFLITGFVNAQPFFDEEDKCGISNNQFKSSLEELGDHWGYSYDSLLADLLVWEQSPYVDTGSIGLSTQEREIYELTVTNFDISNKDKKQVYIHARTHPNEVQSFWVTDEIINLLLGTSSLANYLRENVIFYIVPMYNPDGVELEMLRENANGIDIESNWDKDPVEKEVALLRSRFTELMLMDNPVEVALNMHSAYPKNGQLRYFVCHHANGTSLKYFNLEKFYISGVQKYFQEGIEPYDHMITWSSGTTYRYPESWWWHNHGENVMALTYEDMNSSFAGFYDKTAYALMQGTADYLDSEYDGTLTDFTAADLKVRVSPNPFIDQVNIEWNDFNNFNKARIIDIMGRTVREFHIGESINGKITWNGTNWQGREAASGTYIFQLIKGGQVKNMILVKR